MGLTTVYKLPWPDGPNTADGPDGYKDLAVAIEAAITKQVADLGMQRWWDNPSGGNDSAAVTAKAHNWATAAETGAISNAPAGLYLVSTVLNWWADIETTTWCYEAIQINGTNVMARHHVGTFQQDPAPHTGTTAYLQYSHRHTGGTLSAALLFGNANYDMYARRSSSIFVQRTGP